jgi:hypothetical protein
VFSDEPRSNERTKRDRKLRRKKEKAAAHVAIQVARHWNVEVYASTRDARYQRLALDLGAAWAGGTFAEPPEKLDAAIIFTPAGEIVPVAPRPTNLPSRC